MKTTGLKMGMQWGNMDRNIRGMVMYSLSPYEQKPFAGAIKRGVPNVWRRFCSKFLVVAPPFFLGYMIIDWSKKEHARLMRKNPADYENEEE